MSLDTLEVEVHLIIRNKETQAHAPAFGRGIARLCEGVERTGSLNKACKEMGMAYSKAWKIMHNTEESLGFALLERQGARGSVLTQEAKMLLQAFRETEKVLKEAGEEALSSVLFQQSKIGSRNRLRALKSKQNTFV